MGLLCKYRIAVFLLMYWLLNLANYVSLQTTRHQHQNTGNYSIRYRSLCTSTLKLLYPEYFTPRPTLWSFHPKIRALISFPKYVTDVSLVKNRSKTFQVIKLTMLWWHSIVVRPPVLAGELSLSCARLMVGRVTTLWVRRPLSVNQHGQLSQPSLRGRLMSSNPLMMDYEGGDLLAGWCCLCGLLGHCTGLCLQAGRWPK